MENSVYFVKVYWAGEYDDFKEKINCAFVIAPTYADAIEKITNDFGKYDITKMEIECVNYYTGAQVLYVPDDPRLIEAIKVENDY